jgi:lipid-A-disaccharide synthase
MRCAGIGGPAMQSQGFEAWWPERKLSVRGYVEVFAHLPELLGIRRELRRRLLAQPPDLFIGVDAPDFNLDLEIDLRSAGIPTLHFISPSFWAWRAKKVHKLRRAADHVLCVFPFEPELLRAHGVPATFVGHPLAQMIEMQSDRGAARQALGLQSDATVVALLPGSRQSEISHMLPRFLQAAHLLESRRTHLQFVMPVLSSLRSQVEELVAQAGFGPSHGSSLVRVEGRSHAVLAACDLALVTSGTATLEAALFKRPMVIAYHMPWLSWQIMKGKQLQPWVGLPNILCGEFVVPELIQDQATPSALADALSDWLDQPERCRAVAQRFEQLHLQLRCDTAALACDAIEKVLRR